MDYLYHYESPLGGITLKSDGDALTGLWFDGPDRCAGTHNPAEKEKAPPVLRETERWLDVYFGGREPGFTPKLNMRGTPFQRAVWEAMLAIPYGRTVTYGELARRIADRPPFLRASARAVGGAAGRNAVLLVIPCHRVVGAGGRLAGYAGGPGRKAILLELERTGTGAFSAPDIHIP